MFGWKHEANSYLELKAEVWSSPLEGKMERVPGRYQKRGRNSLEELEFLSLYVEGGAVEHSMVCP